MGQRDATFGKPYINTAEFDPRYHDPSHPLGEVQGVSRRDDALLNLDPRTETPGRKLGDVEGVNRREDMGQRDATFMKPYINTSQFDPRYHDPSHPLGEIQGVSRRDDALL